jgi:squalene cyclase
LVIRNEKRGSVRIQPCKSPVWDTALTLKALMLGGLTVSHPAVRKGVQWVRSRHIKEPGDWAMQWKEKGERSKEKVGNRPPGDLQHPVRDESLGRNKMQNQNLGIPLGMPLLVEKDTSLTGCRKEEGDARSTERYIPNGLRSNENLKKDSATICRLPSAVSDANGWCFEFNNVFYPDCDDTAMALMVLAGRFDAAGTGQLPPDLRVTAIEHAGSLDEAKQSVLDVADTSAAMQSGLRWLLGMQNKDGGWAAFDKNNNKEILCKVPFADHNAMIDPSTPDLTGRVMESLGRLGFRVGKNPEIDRVVAYMRKEQQADGSWFGRWGVNYIYGTWQALTGLSAVGVPTDDPAIAAGANWLLAHQHASGGWGETPDSYEDPSLRGTGTPTASQTAWAVMGLIAAGKTDDPAVTRGIRFLLDRQRPDGTWFEPEYTGTGFPLVFYLKYHYYSVYFPLMALSLYAAKQRVPKLDIDEDEAVLPMSQIRIFSPETGYYNNSRPDDPPPVLQTADSRRQTAAEKERTKSPPVTLRLFLG